MEVGERDKEEDSVTVDVLRAVVVGMDVGEGGREGEGSEVSGVGVEV